MATHDWPSIQETRYDNRITAGMKKSSPCSPSSNHVPSSPLPINKDQGNQSISQLKNPHPICIDSNDPKNQPESAAVVAVLDGVHELKRALLRERRTNAIFQSPRELWQKDCTKLQKELGVTLIWLEDILQNPSKTPPTFVLKDENTPLKFFSKAKRREL